eukprot:Em0003g1693a
MDDVLVADHTEAEHLRTLEEVLARLELYGVQLNKAKCKFMLPSVEYLGFHISGDGVRPTQEKLHAIVDAPTPKDISQTGEVRSLVRQMVLHGWQPQAEDDFRPYEQHKLELSVQNGCVLWGSRLQGRQHVLEILHEGHPGISRMKSLAKGIVWWLKFDADQESLAIQALRRVLTTHDNQQILVSDNGAAFTSSEFQAFVTQNGFKHVRSSPYHPATNGLADSVMDMSPDTMRNMLGLVNKRGEEAKNMKGDDFSPTEPNGDQEDETSLATDRVHQNQVPPATAHGDQSQHHLKKYMSLYHVHRSFQKFRERGSGQLRSWNAGYYIRTSETYSRPSVCGPAATALVAVPAQSVNLCYLDYVL